MAQFLRDEFLTNLTIDEDALTQINQVFAARLATMPEQVQRTNVQDLAVFLRYIIRFDKKGYRVSSLQEVLKYFRQATYVERIIFTLESTTSLTSNRITGSYMELRLDHKDPNTCSLIVSSDASEWVDASFCATIETLTKCKNWNVWVRGWWTQLVIQIFGVFLGFVVSLWAASQISPYLSINNPFLLSFFLALVIFSNLWFYLNQHLLALVNVTFPNIRFYRPKQDKKHWLLQTVVGGVVLAITLYLINQLLSYAGRVLGSFMS